MPDHFIELWQQFRKVRIHLSIDDLAERNYYIRFPSDWDTIMKSFYKILEYKNIFNLEVCQTVSALNVYNIDNFKKFTLDHDLIISHNYVHYPNHLQVNLIPDNMKTEILNGIKYMRDDEIERLKIELFKPYPQKHVDRFHSFMRIMDKTRNVNIEDYLPEWKGIIYE